MSFALQIQDETSSGELIHSSIIQFPVELISARTLIETRVAHEVSVQQKQTHDRFFGLIQPKDAEKDLNGYTRKGTKKIDPKEQQQVAISAFQNNGFFLLVNDKQITELDAEIHITPNSKVVFIKLIPLVGG